MKGRGLRCALRPQRTSARTEVFGASRRLVIEKFTKTEHWEHVWLVRARNE